MPIIYIIQIVNILNILRKKFQTELNNIVTLVNSGQSNIALKRLDALIKSYKGEYNDLHLLNEFYTWKAWIYDQKKEYNKAILFYQKALEYPSNSLAYFNIIHSLSNDFKRIGKKNKALQLLQKGINEIKDSTLKLKLIKTYHSLNGVLHHSTEDTIYTVIKYYGLEVNQENKTIVDLLNLVQDVLNKEIEKFNELDNRIINSKKVSEVEIMIKKYFLNCKSEYFRKRAQETLKEIQNGEKKFNDIMSLVANKPKDFVIDILNKYNSENNPIFYKRLIRDFRKKLD